jgi:hypothetical protein
MYASTEKELKDRHLYLLALNTKCCLTYHPRQKKEALISPALLGCISRKKF